MRPAAQVEFDEAFDWYEEQRPGLGADFAAHVQEVFDRIAERPFMYEEVMKPVRRGVVRRYLVEKTRIVVLAVFHGKRDPAVWQPRV